MPMVKKGTGIDDEFLSAVISPADWKNFMALRWIARDLYQLGPSQPAAA